MAKKQGLWAEIQRERAQRERIHQREFREFRQAEARVAREAAKAERDRKRQAATDERERKKLYTEDRKAEAEAMAEDVRARLTELDELLKAGIRDRPVVTFASLKRTDTYPAFDAGQLGRALPPPVWDDFAPAPPSGLGKVFGGGSVHIVDLPDPAAARAFAFDEPNYQGGAYRDVMVRRWRK